jgi:sirohydrochlorin ferrochelatase
LAAVAIRYPIVPFSRLTLVFALALAGPRVPAQDTTAAIVVAHGAGPEWNRQIREVASSVRLGIPVEVSFLMGPEAEHTRIPLIVKRLEARGVRTIVIVPFLVSSHSEHYQQVRYLAGLTDSLNHELHAHMGHPGGLAQAQFGGTIRVAAALDSSAVLAHVIAERARAILVEPQRQAVFLVGHGPNSAEDYAHWMSNLRPVAAKAQSLLGVPEMSVELVRDDAPAHVRAEAVKRVRELIGLQHRLTGRPVVVVPVLLSRGRISRERFLADLAQLPVTYSGDPLLPHDLFGRWVEQRISESLGSRTAAGR